MSRTVKSHMMVKRVAVVSGGRDGGVARAGRSRGRHPWAAGVVGATLATGVLSASCMVDAALTMTCTGPGLSSDVVLPYRVHSTTTPDQVAPGDVVTMELALTMDAPYAGIPLSATYHLWLPDEISRVEQVTFGAGAFYTSYRVIGREVTFTFADGNATGHDIVLNPITLTARIDPKAPGGTLHWQAPVRADFDYPIMSVQCTVPLDDAKLTTTRVVGPSNPDWHAPSGPTTTTTPPSPTVPPRPPTSRVAITRPAGYDRDLLAAGDLVGTQVLWVTSTAAPSAVRPGGRVGFTLGLALPDVLDLPVSSTTVVLPLPAQIADVSGVVAADGSPVDWRVESGALVVTTGPAASMRGLTLPELRVAATVRFDATPGPVALPPFTQWRIDLGGISETIRPVDRSDLATFTITA